MPKKSGYIGWLSRKSSRGFVSVPKANRVRMGRNCLRLNLSKIEWCGIQNQLILCIGFWPSLAMDEAMGGSPLRRTGSQSGDPRKLRGGYARTCTKSLHNYILCTNYYCSWGNSVTGGLCICPSHLTSGLLL